MTPLDLSVAPPRHPRLKLAGVVLLPRTIDKVRASLPGGSLGEYSIQGFSTTMLERLGIDLEAFVAAVRDAADDQHVASFVERETTAEQIEAWNTFAADFIVRNGDRARALEAYPWLADYDELPKALDALAEDDERHFSSIAPN